MWMLLLHLKQQMYCRAVKYILKLRVAISAKKLYNNVEVEKSRA